MCSASIGGFRPLALFVSQPMSSLGAMSRMEYKDLICAVSESCTAHGFEFFVKWHPSESAIQGLNEAKSKREHGLGIAEELICDLRPAAVIGFSSTVLATAHTLFGITSISVAKLYESKISKESVMHEGNHLFLKKFRAIVKVPQTVDELKAVLADVRLKIERV